MIRRFLDWLWGADLRCDECEEVKTAHRVGCSSGAQPDEPAPDEDDEFEEGEDDDPDSVWLEIPESKPAKRLAKPRKKASRRKA